MTTTVNRIQEEFIWPVLKEDMKEWIKNCPTCSERRTRDQREGQLDNRAVADIGEREDAGLLGPVNPAGTTEEKYILTMIDACFGIKMPNQLLKCWCTNTFLSGTSPERTIQTWGGSSQQPSLRKSWH